MGDTPEIFERKQIIVLSLRVAKDFYHHAWAKTAIMTPITELALRRLLLPLSIRNQFDTLHNDIQKAKLSKAHWQSKERAHSQRNIVDVNEVQKQGRSITNAIGKSFHPLRNKVGKF